MVSFEKLTEKDQALAWGYDNEEGVGTPDFTVWYTPRYKGKTAITSSDVLGLLSSERLVMQSIYGLTDHEWTTLCHKAQNNEQADPAWERGLKRAYLELNKKIDIKLRREVEFEDDENVFLKVAFNTEKMRTRYTTMVVGASGAGKSCAINETLLRNPSLNKSPCVYLFGSQGAEDPSFEPLREHLQERFAYKDTAVMEPHEFTGKFYERGATLIFDDIDSIANVQHRRKMQGFRDICLEVARHRSQIIISSVHLFWGYRDTSRLRNSSRYFFIFPRSVPRVLTDVLDRTFSWKTKRRMDLLSKVQADGRLTVIHTAHPQFIISAKRLILL